MDGLQWLLSSEGNPSTIQVWVSFAASASLQVSRVICGNKIGIFTHVQRRCHFSRATIALLAHTENVRWSRKETKMDFRHCQMENTIHKWSYHICEHPMHRLNSSKNLRKCMKYCTYCIIYRREDEEWSRRRSLGQSQNVYRSTFGIFYSRPEKIAANTYRQQPATIMMIVCQTARRTPSEATL